MSEQMGPSTPPPTPSELTEERLAAIAARADAATPGPWARTTMCHCDDPDDCYDHWDVSVPVAGYDPPSGRVSRARSVAGNIHGHREADAIFIAHAREDIPALLAEIERLRAERDDLREALQAVVDSTCRGAIPPRLAVVQHAESVLGRLTRG